MRRLWLALIVMALLLPAKGETQITGYLWTCSLDNLADSNTVCVVAPEPWMRRYITDISAQSTTANAGLFNLVHGTGTNCATGETQLFPPIGGASASRYAAAGNVVAPTVAVLGQTIIVPSGKDLCAIGDATNAVTIQISGYVAP